MLIKNLFSPLWQFILILAIVILAFVFRAALIVPIFLFDFPAQFLTLAICCGDYPHPSILPIVEAIVVLFYAILINRLIKMDTRIALVVLCLVIVAIITIGATMVFYRSAPTMPYVPRNTPKVIVATDRDYYIYGDIVNIVAENRTDKSILYYGGNDRFWGIEQLIDGNWINPAYEDNGSFQLSDEAVGSPCYVRFYERSQPIELKSGQIIQGAWNLKICPLIEDPTKLAIVKYVDEGTYRIIFYYGYEISQDDPYNISGVKTAYSRSFTVNNSRERQRVY